MRITVKPKRWWWPPDRRKAKVMTLLANHFITPEVEKKIISETIRKLIYG